MVLNREQFALTGVPENDPTVITFPNAGPDLDSIATIRRLSAALLDRSQEMLRFDAYYRGDQGIRFASSKYREQFAVLFSKYAENFCGLIVDAVEERLDVEGFRYPPKDGSEPATPTDKEAWRIWQDNQMDAKSQIAHTEALVKGVVYVLVSPFEQERILRRSPRLTIEDPLQTIVDYAPGTTERLVGMKRWSDTTAKRTYATLYYPDRIEKWQSATWQDTTGRMRTAMGQFAAGEQWERRSVPDEDWPLPHTLGVVPLVPLVNKPRLTGEGESEISDAIRIQDAINKIAMDELIASEASAFRQKWGTGIEIPMDPDTGKPVEPWKPDIERILTTAVPDAKFGTFEATDLKTYVTALDQKVQSLASITRTPYHYFLQHGGQPPSGESLKSAETGLVRKSRRKQRHFGEGWEEVIQLAFKSLGDDRGEVLDSETKWANPESMTEAEHVDALVKLGSIGVPEEQLWEDAGYTPTQIATFTAYKADNAEVPLERPVEKRVAATINAPSRMVVTRADGGQTSIEPASRRVTVTRPDGSKTSIEPG